MIVGYLRVLITALVMGGIMVVFLKLFPKKHKLIFLIAGLVPAVFIIIRLIQRIVTIDHIGYILHGIPFTLCGLCSFLIPFTVLTKNKVVTNFIYFISLPSTILALAADGTITLPLSNFDFWGFVIPHTMYFVHIGLMMFFKYVKPEIKKLPTVLAAFCVMISIMHILNLLTMWLFPTGDAWTTNYIFTMYPGDRGGPPDYVISPRIILEQAWDILPVRYVYLYLLIPVLAVVCGLLSLPLIKKTTYKRFFGRFKRKKAAMAAGIEEEVDNVVEVDNWGKAENGVDAGEATEVKDQDEGLSE